MNPFRHFGETLWMGDRPIARTLQGIALHIETWTHIHACSGIWTHDSNVLSVHKRPTPHDHWERQPI